MAAQYRIACLRIPRFQIVVHQKNDPALKGKPFVIIDGEGNRSEVVSCSREAARRQIRPGMKLSEAKAACADLLFRKYDRELYAAAQKKLSYELIACSPKVTAQEPGIFLIDASGLQHLGGERKLCRNVQKVANRAGFPDVHLGVADTAFAAGVASCFKRRQYFVVPAGDDAQFLSPLPVRYLPVSADMLEVLLALGIKTMGQLTGLPANSLIERFGAEGMRAYELSSGVDCRQPHLPVVEREFKCSVELGLPIELLNETQFVLKSMLDSLTARLKAEGFLAEELLVSFFNDRQKFDERPLKLLRPSSHPRFLLEVLKLSLEARPLTREFTGIVLAVSRYCPESWEQCRMDQALLPSAVPLAGGCGPEYLEAPENKPALDAVPAREREPGQSAEVSLTFMLQRFLAKLGGDAVVRSVPADQYLPEKSGAWLPVIKDSPGNSVLPVNVSYINARVGPSGLASGLALRKSLAPAPVLVEFQGELPTAIVYQGRWHRIKEITEPERLSGLWWERPVRKSYYVALIEPKDNRQKSGVMASRGNDDCRILNETSLLVLLVHDHEESGWYLEGFFD